MFNNFQSELQFSDILKEKDTELSLRLDYIKKRGLEEWVSLLGFEKGTHKGFPHLLNVERNANAIVPDAIKSKFSAGEIFLLLSSIFLHDIGKLIKDSGHNLESKDIIEECWAELGLPDERIASYCAVISYFHGVENPRDENVIGNDRIDINEYYEVSLAPYGSLRVPFLAAILRIADETEDSWRRSLQSYLYDRIKETGINMVKGIRRFIEDVEFCHQGECVILHIPKTIQFRNNNNISERETCNRNADNGVNISSNFLFLNKDQMENLNKRREKISKVIKNWFYLLEEQHIFLKDVYFQYKNNLHKKLVLNENEEIEISKLNKVINAGEAEHKSRIKQLLDAIIDLSLGSLGYDIFSWHSLEAKVGQALSERDKWVIERMNYVAPCLRITFHPKNQIKIQLKESITKEELYSEFGLI